MKSLLSIALIITLQGANVAFAQDLAFSVHRVAGKNALERRDYETAQKEFALAVEHSSTDALPIILEDLARAYSLDHKYAEAQEHLMRGLSIAEAAVGSQNQGIAVGLQHSLVLTYLGAKQYEKAEQAAKKSLSMAKSVFAPKDIGYVAVYWSLGDAYFGEQKYESAEETYRSGLSLLDGASGQVEDTVRALILEKMANCLVREGKFADAESLYMKAFKINEYAFGPDDPKTAMNLNSLARLYAAQGKSAQAERLFKRAVLTLQENDDPLIVEPLMNYAEFLRKIGRNDEAKTLDQRVANFRAQKHVLTDLEFSISESSQQGMAAKNAITAETYFLAALKTSQALPASSPRRVTVLVNLADFYQKQKRVSEAVSYWEQALSSLKPIFGSDHPPLELAILERLLMNYFNQGDYAKSEPICARLMSVREQFFGPESPEVANGLIIVAALDTRLKRYREAEAAYEKALSLHSKLNLPLGPEYPKTGKGFVEEIQKKPANATAAGFLVEP